MAESTKSPVCPSMNILINFFMDLHYPKRLLFYSDQKKGPFHNYAQKLKEGFNLSDDLL